MLFHIALPGVAVTGDAGLVDHRGVILRSCAVRDNEDERNARNQQALENSHDALPLTTGARSLPQIGAYLNMTTLINTSIFKYLSTWASI